MKVLHPGDSGPDVKVLRDNLRRVGFNIEPGDVYDPQAVRCVKTFQQDARLGVDGVVGNKETWPLLLQSASEAPPMGSDDLGRSLRFSKMVTKLWDPEKFRMIPGYWASSIKEWEKVEKGGRGEFVVPRAAISPRYWGATCGHAAWVMTHWWFRAMHPGKGIFPTWRTGRGPDKGMPLRFTPLAPVDGIMYGTALHRGLEEFVSRKFRLLDICDLARESHGGHWFYLQWQGGHVVLAVVIDDDFSPIDPRTGILARHGAYRLAADGTKSKMGQPWTWKRITLPDPGYWTCWQMEELDLDGRPLCLFTDQPDYPLVLE